MAEPLKNLYNEAFFNTLTQACKKVIPQFDSSLFAKSIYDSEWENKELKERLRHITITLKEQMPDDYSECISLVIDLIPALKDYGAPSDTFEYTFLPDFIQLFGTDDHEISIHAMEKITRFVTCEFAIRPFLIQYPDLMRKQMLIWSTHKHPAVRRLSSEGYRPRLPWAMGVPSLKKDPSPILPILENLKTDPSESVRRSVANNLNDISKDHPELVIEIAKRWKGTSKETDRLVKHACRTLLKQGNRKVMSLFGYGSTDDISVTGFEILTPKVTIGDSLEFNFELKNLSSATQKVRVEYGIYYLRANGSHSKKVFKISEKEYSSESSSHVNRSQSFRPITTKVFYPGKHILSIILNGIEIDKKEFELVA
ncbi:MAG: hypothetical protein JJ971_08570 [Balneolaceae bacterium]|nr:hypothetical protein [Balneolaceae bacterium]MBO6649065.1 hypothetical protein [Balneolaceae bacterium]